MTVKTRVQINTDADTYINDNTAEDITPADIRSRIKDLADSVPFSAELAPVATSGTYASLSGKPTLGTASALNSGTSAGNVPVLDGGGKIPAAVLPAYVDDVLEYANLAALPVTGTAGLIYVTIDTNKTYRWSGSAYVEISASPGSTDAVTEGATNKYYTDTRVRAAVLTGLSLATGTAIAAADTVLSAFGKLQKQITDLSTSVSSLLGLARREVLTANRTYYVRPDGNDANTGLVNNAGGAFLTLQKAINVVGGLDISIYDVTINVADATYTAGISLMAPWVGMGTVSVIGNVGTPANAIISTAGDAIYVGKYARLTVAGFKLQTSTNGSGINADRGGTVTFSAMEFGTTFGLAQVRAGDGSAVTCTGNYTISGSCPRHFLSVASSIIRVEGVTVTITGTPAFSTAFANCTRNAVLIVNSTTWSGSATGSRYAVASNAVIDVSGAGITYFPGDAVGTGTNSGVAPFGLYQ